jgi:hypothetical protein
LAERQRASRDESVDASVDALKEEIQRARSEIEALRERLGGNHDQRCVRSGVAASLPW